MTLRWLRVIAIGLMAVTSPLLASPIQPHQAHTGVNLPYHINASKFDSVVAEGDMHIHIAGGGRISVRITGSVPHIHQRLQWHVRHHTLYLAEKSPNNATHKTIANINIRMPRLRYLELRGNIALVANNLHAKHLVINSHTDGDVRINGSLDLENVWHDGHGDITLQNVTGNHIKITNHGQGKVKLAGVAKILNAKAYGNSTIDARFLRARNGLAQAAGRAHIHITAVNSLSAFASDHSEIDYYKKPKHLTHHTVGKNSLVRSATLAL